MIRIGMFGYGVVAQGLTKALRTSRHENIEIRKVCVKSGNKKRDLDPTILTTDENDIWLDPDVNVIVELIDDSSAAFKIARKAYEAGLPFISANKKMIAENIVVLHDWIENGFQFRYEGAVGGSIPIFHSIEHFY